LPVGSKNARAGMEAGIETMTLSSRAEKILMDSEVIDIKTAVRRMRKLLRSLGL